MPHKFLVKEIALQAGVGAATVDRVLNGRAHVRDHTRRRVEQAIRELEKQARQLDAAGRKLIVDVLVEAPARFADEIGAALDAELPGLHPAVFRPRLLMRETLGTAEVVEALRAIGKRGSHGVLLKARDEPAIAEAIAALHAQGIPVVTIFTDLPGSARLAYAGPDNRVAGATAAWLIGQWLGERSGKVLVTLSDERFRGEEEREISFRRALRSRYPKLGLIDASGGHGLDAATGERVRAALGRRREIVAVYSMGGGNAAIVAALEARRLAPVCFVGHDLDRDNIRLLREGRLHAVLHHDLRQDLRAACQHLMHFHRLLPAGAIAPCSSLVVITPENIPAHIAARFA